MTCEPMLIFALALFLCIKEIIKELFMGGIDYNYLK